MVVVKGTTELTVLYGTSGVVLVLKRISSKVLEEEKDEGLKELPTLENSEEDTFEEVLRFEPTRGGCSCGCICGCSCGLRCGSGCCVGALALIDGTTRDVRLPSKVGRT